MTGILNMQNNAVTFNIGGHVGFNLINTGADTLKIRNHDNTELGNINHVGVATFKDFYFSSSNSIFPQQYISTLLNKLLTPQYSTVTILDNTFILRDSNPKGNCVVRMGQMVTVSLSLYKTGTTTHTSWDKVFTLPWSINSMYFVPFFIVASQTAIYFLCSGKDLYISHNLEQGMMYANFTYFTTDT